MQTFKCEASLLKKIHREVIKYCRDFRLGLGCDQTDFYLREISNMLSGHDPVLTIFTVVTGVGISLALQAQVDHRPLKRDMVITPRNSAIFKVIKIDAIPGARIHNIAKGATQLKRVALILKYHQPCALKVTCWSKV